MDLAEIYVVALDILPNVTFTSLATDTVDGAERPFPPCQWIEEREQGILSENSLTVYDQICEGCPQTFFNNGDDSTAFITASVSLTATTADLNLPVDFDSSTHFFGLNGQSPDTTFNIIPEPNPSLLLVMGLVGLTAACPHGRNTSPIPGRSPKLDPL